MNTLTTLPPGVKVSSAAEAEKQLSAMLQFCYSSSDEVFHVFLYEWLIGNGLVNRYARAGFTKAWKAVTFY